MTNTDYVQVDQSQEILAGEFRSFASSLAVARITVPMKGAEVTRIAIQIEKGNWQSACEQATRCEGKLNQPYLNDYRNEWNTLVKSLKTASAKSLG